MLKLKGIKFFFYKNRGVAEKLNDEHGISYKSTSKACIFLKREVISDMADMS